MIVRRAGVVSRSCLIKAHTLGMGQRNGEDDATEEMEAKRDNVKSIAFQPSEDSQASNYAICAYVIDNPTCFQAAYNLACTYMHC